MNELDASKEYSYQKHINPYYENYLVCEIDKTGIDKINESTEEHCRAKIQESQYKLDGDQIRKRFSTGRLCEYACEKHLGISIIDWTIGYSSRYNVPDITIKDSRFKNGKFECGIKGVRYDSFNPKFPIIEKRNNYPQIICIVTPHGKKVHICGVASPLVLNTYQNDYLILSKSARDKGFKTGFYGFSKLKSFQNLDDLKEICLSFH